MEQCKTCVFFTRGKWHKSVDEDESDQLGGKCKMIKQVLSITNSVLWVEDDLHVQETFGCILHKPNNPDILTDK